MWNTKIKPVFSTSVAILVSIFSSFANLLSWSLWQVKKHPNFESKDDSVRIFKINKLITEWIMQLEEEWQTVLIA